MAEGVYVEGLRETKRKLRELPKDTDVTIKERSGKIAQVVADEAKRRFVALGRQGPLVASTLRSIKGNTPIIRAGGSARLGHNRKPAFKLLYGTEFGSNKYKQFHASHTGTTGRALYPTVRARTEWMVEEWSKATDDVLRRFGEGG